MKGKVLPLEVVEINFFFPTQNKYLPHPALVVSSAELFEDEEMFYAVLMTTKNIFEKYTVRIEPDWLTKPARRDGYFATHFVQLFTMKEVLNRNNTFLKPEHFAGIKAKIIDSIFHHG